MRNRTETRWVWLLAVMLFTPAMADDSWILVAAEWSRPRSGSALVEMQPVADAVRAWHAAGDSARLVLVHAGGEAGGLWAAELRDWLVALGLPPRAVQLAPGGQPAGRLEIRLEQGH